MAERPVQNIGQELDYQARHAAEVASIRPTPAATLERYRQHRNWRINSKEFLFHSLANHSPKRVCDFGCGAGETGTELAAAGYQVIGFDISPEMIALARRRAELDHVTDRTEFVVANAAELELRSGNFDAILVQAVLHHIELDKGLATLDALLAPGGVAVIIEPVAFSSLLQKLRDLTPVPKDISPNERQLNQSDIVQIEAKFDVLEKRHFHLFTRFARLVPERFEGLHMFFFKSLATLDWLALSCLPLLRRFAGALVLVCRKK
jgi:2-polyprenyl-3-methyl-5-hydroxy-6-metoxy-1,4-benzoquinol methylase